MSRKLLALLVCFAFSVEADDSRSKFQPVKARIFADAKVVKPGAKILVGVLFNMEEPWHIYWKNPGETGLPTRIKLSLPLGYVAGEIQWPQHEEFVQPGNVKGYGYSDQVLLYQEVSVPPEVIPGTAAGIDAEVRWLACADLCVPGRASLMLEIPVGSETLPANSELFEEWKARVPPVDS